MITIRPASERDVHAIQAVLSPEIAQGRVMPREVVADEFAHAVAHPFPDVKPNEKPYVLAHAVAHVVAVDFADFQSERIAVDLPERVAQSEPEH